MAAAEDFMQAGQLSDRINILCFFYACCSMMYFLLFTRALAEMTGDVMLWSAVASAVYLCSLGLGIAFSQKRWHEPSLGMVAKVEVLSAAWGACAIVGLYLWHMIYRIYMYDFGFDLAPVGIDQKLLFALLAQLLLAGVGLLSGAAFGVVSQLAHKSDFTALQKTLAIYQLGGLVGSLLLLLILLPRFEPLELGIATSLCNILVALIWIGITPTMGSNRRVILRLVAGVTCLILSIIGFVGAVDLTQAQIKNFYYNEFGYEISAEGIVTHLFPTPLSRWFFEAKKFPDVERHRGLYQTIDIVRHDGVMIPRQPMAASWTLYLDGHFQLSSSHESDYHQAMTHIPSALSAPPQSKVLVIGGGDGMLARELLRYQAPEFEITLVDIDPMILQLATEHDDMRRLNHASLIHPRVQVVISDAFQFLRRSNETFDRIFVDVLFPFNFETSRLYSVEFFDALKRHLQPNGSVSILSPIELDEIRDPANNHTLTLLTDTLSKAGLQDIYLYGEKRHTFFLAKPRRTSDLTQIDWRSSAWAKLINNPENMQNLRQLKPSSVITTVNSILHPRFFGVKDTNF